MKKSSKIIISSIILLIILLILLIVLPSIANINIQGSYPFKFIKLYFDGDNKNYFEVIFSGITILITFLIFYWQSQIELQNKIQEIEVEKEKHQKIYLEKRERERAAVRPLFLVELQRESSKIKSFIRENAPLTNVTVYFRNMEDEEFQEKFIGNVTSGETVFKFDSEKLESAIIECRTYLEEHIYFQYHVGNNLLHYRIVDGENLDYIRNILKRRILNDIADSSLTRVIEIYGSQLQYSYYEDIYFNKFIDFLLSNCEFKFSLDDKLLYSSIVLGQEEIESVLSRAIDVSARITYKETPEIFIEVLEVINKYLKDYYYTNCKEVKKENRGYFISNIRIYMGTILEKYVEIFEKEPINQEIITRYIDDLIIYLKDSKKMVELALRNVEVYVRDYVTISKDRVGYPNEMKYAIDQVRNDLRKVFSKYV